MFTKLWTNEETIRKGTPSRRILCMVLFLILVFFVVSPQFGESSRPFQDEQLLLKLPRGSPVVSSPDPVHTRILFMVLLLMLVFMVVSPQFGEALRPLQDQQLLLKLQRGPPVVSSPDPVHTRRILFMVIVMVFIITVAFSEGAASSRPLHDEHDSVEFDSLLLQFLPRGPLKPSAPDPIRP
ncbi:uncharacterized protein HKW66_Vig0249640 [Vigna angularis]|uniref:Uncharacterized protein n=1 Tax=Phaseolus angularis TaxID=3914 RepID=A0A8T0KY91_PHAAN|nr:uncharacterized protein HKW66_Vig0249600 [Vigna angularis]KAG2402745.1 uncharacterized protein HKW66_Vig0249640 [Vigna angularis]